MAGLLRGGNHHDASTPAPESEDVAQNVSDTTPLLQPPSSAETVHVEQDESKLSSYPVVRNVLIAACICILLFLQGSNISALTTIQSTVARELQALSKSSWLTSSYVIALSSTSPLLGRFCKIFSPRVCIFVASFVFALGTVITGLAPNFVGFLAGRAITGMGGAGIVACSIILVLELASETRRGVSLGLINTGFTTGVSLGAVVAGALLSSIGWRAIFLAQAPFSAVAGTAIFFIVPKSSVSRNESVWQQLGKIDYLGVVTLTATLVLFLVSLASTEVLIIPLVASAFTLLLFLAIEARYATDPIIPISVLKSRGALLGSSATAILMMVRWMVLFYAPLYAIAVRGWDLSVAGTMLIPANAGFALGGLVVGWLHIRRAGSFYLSCIVVLALFVATVFLLSRISTPTSPVAGYVLSIFANGLCTGAALNYTLVHILHLTTPSVHFIMTSLMTTFRGFGASFGSAIGGGIFARALTASFLHLRNSCGLPPDQGLLDELLGSPTVVASLQGVEKEIAIESYVHALTSLFTAGAAICVVAVVFQAGTGWTAPKEDSDEETI